jgi:hypothetical protein
MFVISDTVWIRSKKRRVDAQSCFTSTFTPTPSPSIQLIFYAKILKKMKYVAMIFAHFVNKEEFNQFVFLLEKKQDIYVLFITR